MTSVTARGHKRNEATRFRVASLGRASGGLSHLRPAPIAHCPIWFVSFGAKSSLRYSPCHAPAAHAPSAVVLAGPEAAYGHAPNAAFEGVGPCEKASPTMRNEPVPGVMPNVLSGMANSYSELPALCTTLGNAAP